MCGILAILRQILLNHQDVKFLEELISKRGPDHQSALCEYPTKCNLTLFLKASVLHLRGATIQEQPIVDDRGNILLFNGQIYKFLGIPLERNISDTRFLTEKLKLCTTKVEIAETFAEIDGPFAFLYWSNDLKSLFFGRDFFGRRSLCMLKDNKPSPIVISSLAIQLGQSEAVTWSEVNCAGFNCIDFSNSDELKETRFLWNLNSIYPVTKKCHIIPEETNVNYVMLKSRPIAPLNPDQRPLTEFSEVERQLALRGIEEKLLQSVAIRVHVDVDKCLNCRRTPDSLTKCSHSKVAVAFSGGIDSTLLALALDKVVCSDESIDLVTVAFKENSPDRVSAGSAFKELRELCPHRNWRLVLCDINKSELEQERERLVKYLIAPCRTVLDDSLGCACWFIGRARGRALDSLMEESQFKDNFDCFLEYMDDPRQAILNKNWANLENISVDYTSPATMFFVGASIDEQLGGYSSHRAAWTNSSAQGVYEEISFLMRRISSRNLGRDDRAYAYHGRDIKIPYLDFDLVSYLNQLPISLKMNLNESLEVGPKKILRDLAVCWGLKDTSRRVKRALQFGTRIANLENPKEKGDEICARLI